MNKQEIARKLTEKHLEFADFASNLSEAEYTFAPAGKWTAGQQLDHILRSVSPVKTALSLPKFIPGVLFGKARRESLDYEAMVKNYREKLAAGGKASGRFVPPEVAFKQRDALSQNLRRTVAALTGKIENYTERQLDGILLPHPLLGKLTVREMLYSTIYHVGHHYDAARRNLAK